MDWSTPSSIRRRWISFEHTLDTGMLVGSLTEHPAPITKAILPPAGAETACNNSGGRATITPLTFSHVLITDEYLDSRTWYEWVKLVASNPIPVPERLPVSILDWDSWHKSE